MDDLQTPKLVKAALRCYPRHWQKRHGDEAAELAALLIRDGTPAFSVASSYLAGAVREWLTPRPGRRLSTVACALLAAVCSLGISAALLASTAPAKAASTSTSTTHPHGHPHCRPGTQEPVPSASPAEAHSQGATREASHARSC
jgi:hypothetical protein